MSTTLLQRKKNGGKRGCSIPSTPDQILNVKDLIMQLSQANTVDVLYALGHSPKSWSILLEYFGMTRKQSGHLGHFIRICINNKLIQKDSRLDAFHLTYKGKVALDFLKSIEKFANNSMETPYHHTTIPELKLDMERPWLETILRQEIRKAIKQITQDTKPYHTREASCQTMSEEKEELLQQKRIKNRNRVLYRNLRKILNDARQYSDVVNYENELFCLRGVLFGIEKRIAELEQKGIGIQRHEDLERTCKYCNIPVLKSIYKQHLQSEEHKMNFSKRQSGDSV